MNHNPAIGGFPKRAPVDDDDVWPGEGDSREEQARARFEADVTTAQDHLANLGRHMGVDFSREFVRYIVAHGFRP